MNDIVVIGFRSQLELALFFSFGAQNVKNAASKSLSYQNNAFTFMYLFAQFKLRIVSVFRNVCVCVCVVRVCVLYTLLYTMRTPNTDKFSVNRTHTYETYTEYVCIYASFWHVVFNNLKFKNPSTQALKMLKFCRRQFVLPVRNKKYYLASVLPCNRAQKIYKIHSVHADRRSIYYTITRLWREKGTIIVINTYTCERRKVYLLYNFTREAFFDCF